MRIRIWIVQWLSAAQDTNQVSDSYAIVQCVSGSGSSSQTNADPDPKHCRGIHFLTFQEVFLKKCLVIILQHCFVQLERTVAENEVDRLQGEIRKRYIYFLCTGT